jgi:hypothetical protein
MYVMVKTLDGQVAALNTDQITHVTIAAFSGNGCKIHFTSKDAISVPNTLEDILSLIQSPGTADTLAPT